MHVVLLGAAAGGGFPQWNCWCRSCRTARANPAAAHPRTQSSAAVSADGQRWFLLNASPDIRQQLRWLEHETPSAIRHVPFEGVVLTDAEIDHSLGIVLLREAGCLSLYATPATLSILEEDSGFAATTRAFSRMPVTELVLDDCVPLRHGDGSPSGLTVEPFAVAADPPRFASKDVRGHTVGLMLREDATARTCAFVPGCGALDAPLMDRLSSADALFFDGTFWQDDELIALGIGTRTARQLDHLPIAGPGGSLDLLSALPCRHRIYTHINNTNPILIEDSPEREAVARAGLQVGFDGLRVSL